MCKHQKELLENIEEHRRTFRSHILFYLTPTQVLIQTQTQTQTQAQAHLT